MEVFAFIAIAAAIGAVARFGAQARRARALRAADRTTIAAAPEGRRARIVGEILDGDTFVAPATGRRCVYFALTIERYTGSQYAPWEILVTEARGVAFTIADGTGRAIIDPAGADIEIDRDAGLRSATIDDATPIALAALDHYRIARPTGLFAKRVRYREAALEVGATVAVVGVAVREPDRDAVADVSGYRDGPPTMLHLNSAPAQRLLISDAPDAVG